MAGEEEALVVLEERVKRLEEKTIGPLPKDAEYPEVVTTLASLGGQLGNALSTRDRMMMVMKRLDELERYLDPSYGESLDLWDSAKADLVIAQEEKLRATHQDLTTINALKPVLQSQHIADCANLGGDLISVWNGHNTMEDTTAIQNNQVKQLLSQYNEIISTLTETFVKMDEIVTKAEIAALPKKPED